MSKSIQFKDSENEKIYPHPYYPIGSIFLSVNETNPSTWFGGTWEQIAQGRTLVGVDTDDTDFNTVKKTGGSKELQSHHHGITTWNYYSNKPQGGTKISHTFDSADGGLTTAITSNTGSGNSGNLQPYFTCYIWCRVA